MELVLGSGVTGTFKSSGGSSTTWNPSDKSANINLADGNLEAITSGSSFAGVRSTTSYSTGKYYAELTVTNLSSQVWFGIANSSASLSNFPGSDTNGMGLRCTSSSTFVLVYNNSAIVPPGTWSGTIMQIALDMTDGLIWFNVQNLTNGWNANATASPSTGTGGFSITSAYPITGSILFDFTGAFNSDVGTANFGNSAYTYTPPSGFGPA